MPLAICRCPDRLNGSCLVLWLHEPLQSWALGRSGSGRSLQAAGSGEAVAGAWQDCPGGWKPRKAQPTQKPDLRTARTLGSEPQAQGQNPAKRRRRRVSRPGTSNCGVVWRAAQRGGVGHSLKGLSLGPMPGEAGCCSLAQGEESQVLMGRLNLNVRTTF